MEGPPLLEWSDWGRAGLRAPLFSCTALWVALVGEQLLLPVAPTTLWKVEGDHQPALDLPAAFFCFFFHLLPSPAALWPASWSYFPAMLEAVLQSCGVGCRAQGLGEQDGEQNTILGPGGGGCERRKTHSPALEVPQPNGRHRAGHKKPQNRIGQSGTQRHIAWQILLTQVNNR